jgi:hypothetical protein
MRRPCVECKHMVGHGEGCFLNPPPSRRVASGNPLVIDALIQTAHRQTWTA